MEFRILGPFEVLEDGRDLTPRRAKQRALLAMLVLLRALFPGVLSASRDADRALEARTTGRL
jgi:hypothetical protein